MDRQTVREPQETVSRGFRKFQPDSNDYEATRASLDEDHLAAARERAGLLGMERGLAWVGQVARGESAVG